MINLDRLIFLVFVVGAFLGGMRYENLSMNKDKLKDTEAAQKIDSERSKAADEVAVKVLDGLSNWKKNTETVVREMHFETTKPVFYNVCATDDYVRMFNSVQQQSRDTLTNKPKISVSN